jgi:uncharacterized membrane protein YoaK (UPF0700 family)
MPAPAESVTNPLTRALLALTFGAGIVDAVSFLALGTVFSATMNGNILLLGFGIAGEGDLPVIAPLVALVVFSIGAFGGSAVGRRSAETPVGRLGATTAIETALIAAAAAYAFVVDVEPGELSAGVVIAVLAFAMGLRTATARAINVPDLSTTLVTLPLVALAAEGGRESAATARRRVSAVVALFFGALAGALLLRTTVGVALLAAAAVSGLAGLDHARAAARTAA